MPYSFRRRSDIITEVLSIFTKRLENAIDSDSLEDFLELVGIEIELEKQINPAYYLYNHGTKIYVLGALAGKKKDYIVCAKGLGIDEKNLEFIEYDEMKTFSIEKLRYSSTISDIICGPMPHKIKGIGDYSSFISLLKSKPDEYPKAYIATANDVLKINLSNFRQGLLQSRFLEKFHPTK